MENKSIANIKKRLAITVIAFFVCLVAILALSRITVDVNDNEFTTGNIKINLNDDVRIINEDEFLFEPGMVVDKEFFIKNESDFDIYCRLYFKNIDGQLKDIIHVTLKYNDQVLFDGKMSELSQDNKLVIDEAFKPTDSKYYHLVLEYPEEEGNRGQNGYLNFDLQVDAVQAVNNDGKEFE